jgi:hypothetical protein
MPGLVSLRAWPTPDQRKLTMNPDIETQGRRDLSGKPVTYRHGRRLSVAPDDGLDEKAGLGRFVCKLCALIHSLPC